MKREGQAHPGGQRGRQGAAVATSSRSRLSSKKSPRRRPDAARAHGSSSRTGSRSCRLKHANVASGAQSEHAKVGAQGARKDSRTEEKTAVDDGAQKEARHEVATVGDESTRARSRLRETSMPKSWPPSIRAMARRWRQAATAETQQAHEEGVCQEERQRPQAVGRTARGPASCMRKTTRICGSLTSARRTL